MTVTRELLPTLVPSQWDSAKPGVNTGFNRVRHLQSINDLAIRPVVNRATATDAPIAIDCDGSVQSSGLGTIALTPVRYAEFTVKARVTFQIDSAGPAYVSVYRTTGNIPANGSAPNAGDVVVGGDAFMGGATTAGVNESGALSFLDTGLSQTTQYRYYLAVMGPIGSVLQLVNSSQLLVMERS